jgi:hypothetical protein
MSESPWSLALTIVPEYLSPLEVTSVTSSFSVRSTCDRVNVLIQQSVCGGEIRVLRFVGYWMSIFKDLAILLAPVSSVLITIS